jgi:ubiquinone biosynthesis protein
MDENQLAMQQQIMQLNAALEAQRQQKRNQTLGLLATGGGVLLWWQAYALAIPEVAGLGLSAFGILWLIVKG